MRAGCWNAVKYFQTKIVKYFPQLKYFPGGVKRLNRTAGEEEEGTMTGLPSYRDIIKHFR